MALFDKERSIRIGERDTIGPEFYGDDVPTGVTVSSGTVAVSPATGLTLGSGTAIVTSDAKGCYAWVTGVTAGEYYVTFTVTFSDGKILPRVWRVIVPDPTLLANSLVSVTDFCNYYGSEGLSVSAENQVEQIIHAVSQEFDRFCGRVLKQATFTALYLDGNGETILNLPSWPAASLGTVTEAGTLLAEGLTGSFVLYSSDDDAYLRKVSGTWPELHTATGVWYKGPKTVLISTVKLGYATVPSDLKLACLKQVAVEYQRMKLKTWGETSRSKGEDSSSLVEPGLPRDVTDVLKSYRRIGL